MEHYKELPTNLLLSLSTGAFGFFLSDNFVPAVILPIAFFVIGKTVDVLLKIYLAKRKKQDD